MATQLINRKQRGEQIQPQDIEQINFSTFWVKSQSGKGGYSVTEFKGKWSCDCPDNRYRGVTCKHIHAVLQQTAQEPNWLYLIALGEASF